MASSNTHLLLVPFLSWGHCRPLYALAARVVSESENVIVTILITSFDFERARSEIERQFEAGSTNRQRIRLISIFHQPQVDLVTALEGFEKSYPTAYEGLAQAKPITCATTGTSFKAISAPATVITDFVSPSTLKSTRSLTGHSVPVIAWCTLPGSSLIQLWGPESMGGAGDIGAKLSALAAHTGKPLFDPSHMQLLFTTTGRTVKLPGVPAMYDHEFIPQTYRQLIPFSLLISSYELLMESDALLMASPDAFEQESLAAVREWFSGLNKPVYVVGPFLPTESASNELDSNKSDDVKVATFLDEMLQQHGAHSLVFISFGSMIWGDNHESLEEVVEALLEKNVPFVLSHANLDGQVSNELLQKIHSSDSGLLVSWSPQQFILKHSVTGWFLTHAGYGGVTESLASGVPLICWPFAVDQPVVAAHVTENLKVGFELFEVRTGSDGLKPLHRNGLTPKGSREAIGIEIRRVLEACFGKEGEEKRGRANDLKREFRESWEVNGTSRVAMNEFLKKFAGVSLM